MKKIAVITTHPIQYNAPLFKLLSQRGKLNIKVFYTWGQSKDSVYDARFGRKRRWDIPLLEGYQYTFLNNISRRPDSNRFFGIINPGLMKKLRTEKFDAILIYRWSLWSHFFLLQSNWSKTKLFFRGDSLWKNTEDNLKNYIRRIFFKLLYRKVDKVFYVGRLNKQYFLKSGITENNLIYAPHAIDNQRFEKARSQQDHLAIAEREKLKIPMSAIVFLYAGKFYRPKHLELLINSFKNIEGSQYRLLLYGGGEDEIKLKEIASSDNRIIFQPFRNQSEMPWVYRVGDVFVLPSLSETWGLSINEAMACARPAIASSNCGCAPELILNGETGFTFKSGDEIDLLKKLQEFGSREHALSMGINALHHVQKFSLQDVAVAIEKAVLQ